MEVAAASHPANPVAAPAAANEPTAEVIDLTLSESEEEDDEDDEGSDGGGSDVSEVEIHLNEDTRSQLRTAIATVSEARLREVLQELVERDQAVAIALMQEFVTVKRETKSVVPRWELCANCATEYDVNCAGGREECMFHPGELEVDEEAFPDWDEDCHGPMDTKANRRQWPENFTWSCCEENGRSDGCVQGSHKPEEPSKKRKRYGYF